MKTGIKMLAAALCAAPLCAAPLQAAAQQKTAADGIAEYRKMLEDGNPADLFEAKGESLWKQARGPKKATLEKCDLGLGPGVVKGAKAGDKIAVTWVDNKGDKRTDEATVS